MAIRWWKQVAAVLAFALAGCGGGGGGSDGSGASAGGIISGTATKGPVAGATATAYAIESGHMGRVLGSAVSDGEGRFSIPVGAYAGPALVRVAGGHFTDEATGLDTPMQPGDFMSAMVPSFSSAADTGIQVTPITSMAQAYAEHMAGGMTDGNIAAANGALGCYFAAGDILHVPPMNPLLSGGAGPVGADARNYGMALAAMSQLAANLGMPYASGLVAAMMDDASDGWLNGMMGDGPVAMHGGMMGGGAWPSYAGTSGLSNAMAQFVGSPRNRSGITLQDMQALVNRLMAASGQVSVPGGCAGP